MSGNGRTARTRLALVGLLGLAACAAIVARVTSLSLLQGDEWRREAERQQQRTVRLAPDRGSFLDRDGRELAGSVPAWSAWIDPSALPAEQVREAAHRLARTTPLRESTLVRRLSRNNLFVWIERRVTPERRAELEALKIPGMGFVKESRRVCPQGVLAADVLGLVGTDGEGLEGLEHVHDADVAGKPGLLLTARDARGAEFLPAGLSYRAPTRGADVVLTLDSRLQHVAERELDAAMERTRSRAGCVIITFPGTGEIAALANRPTFNPNKHPTNPSHLRTNRAVASCYEPGSTLKIVTAAAALESGSATVNEIFDCGRGSIVIGRTRIRDHASFDRLDMAGILEQSSNVGAMQLAGRTGAKRFHATLSRFGFGRRTDVGLPGESAGILHPAASWSPVTLATVGFGQEIAVSPLQLALAASAIANGGTLHAPRLVKEIRHADETVTVPALARSQRAVSEKTARTVSSLLEGVVLRGTGRAAAVDGYRVAGKTGTAQVVGDDGAYRTDAFIASFVGWIPADNPVILALIVLDDPQGNYHGGGAAAPVFAGLARDAMRLLAVPPNEPGHLALLGDGGVSAL